MSTSQTVHFAANWKNRESIVTGLCSKFSLRGPQAVATTTEHSKVTCTRCAKSLGIEAAPKAVSSTRGTCQCCFGKYETREKADGWKSVLHGYKRPGYGYIEGECRGAGHLPFEVSCEQTKVWAAELAEILVRQESYLENLKAGKVETLLYSARTEERRVTKLVEIKKGDDQKNNPHKKWDTIPSYEYQLKNVIFGVEQGIAAIKSDLKNLTRAIKSWKPVPFPLSK